MLELIDVQATIGENLVLRGVSLKVPRETAVAVLGANGAGKTSLIRSITGSLRIKSGKILLKDQEIQDLPTHAVSRLGVATVPEGRRTFVDMSVADNLMMGAYLPRARKQYRQTMEEVLTLFPVLRKRLGQRAGTLSGGEQQMLAIGRALMSRPEMLILDELSLGLAPLVVQDIYRVLEKVRERTTMLLVEQSVDMALQNTSYTYIMETGRVTREGPSTQLIDDPEIKKAYLGI
jgi:branched-chain amino acid transport system ATP-binding protein